VANLKQYNDTVGLEYRVWSIEYRGRVGTASRHSCILFERLAASGWRLG
jgi:hypothetical protein